MILTLTCQVRTLVCSHLRYCPRVGDECPSPAPEPDKDCHGDSAPLHTQMIFSMQGKDMVRTHDHISYISVMYVRGNVLFHERRWLQLRLLREKSACSRRLCRKSDTLPHSSLINLQRTQILASTSLFLAQ